MQGKEPPVPFDYEAGWDSSDVLNVMEKGEKQSLALPGFEPFLIQHIAYGLYWVCCPSSKPEHHTTVMICYNECECVVKVTILVFMVEVGDSRLL
jgi:hypothetical protein